MSVMPRRPGGVPGDRLLLVVLVVLIVGAPTVFSRTAMLSFTIPQLTFLWVAAVAALFVGTYRVAVSGVLDREPLPLTVASVSFAAALALTSVVSPQPWVAFTGLSARGAGALTYLLCLALLHVVYGLTRRRSAESLVSAFVVSHVLVVLYALLQAYGLDPISWGDDTSKIGNLVFSTLGNANFSSGYVGLTLPLLVWVAFGSSHPSAVKVVAGATIGASMTSLIYLNSFQGRIAALVAVAVLVQWAMTRGRGDRLGAVLVVLPPAAVIGGLPLVLTDPVGPWSLSLFCVMAAGAACTGFGVLCDRKRADQTDGEPDEATGSWFWPTTAAVLGAVGVVGVLFWGRIVEEVRSGLEQRVELWNVSLSIFRESPLVGRGLETYSTYFTAHRSVDHAIQYQHLLSDSPHSVHLGILSGGGLVLASTYLAVLLVIGYFGVQAVRNAAGSSKLFYGAVFAAWVAYHVQASVSMDVPGLIYAQWVLGGVLVAGGASVSLPALALPWKPRKRHARRLNGGLGLRHLAAAVGLALAFFFVLGPLLAPLRANRAVYRAQVALAVGDPSTAEIELARAIELQPRNGYYAESMAFVHKLGGDLEAAFAQMDRGASLQPGIPYIALKAARAAVAVDRQDTAEYWYERALDSDPNGGAVLGEAQRFYVEIGNAERADELWDDIESLWTPEPEVVAIPEVIICDGNIPELMTGTDIPSVPGTLNTALGSPAGTVIYLSWSAPRSAPKIDCGADLVTGYKIETSTGIGGWTILVPNTGSKETRHSSTGLLPGTAYWYRVSAINSIGTGPPSNTSVHTTEYEAELLDAMTEALSAGEVITAGPHPVLRSDYPVTHDGEKEFRNARQEKSAMFRSHFAHLVATGALPAGKISIDWNPETGVAQIKIRKD